MITAPEVRIRPCLKCGVDKVIGIKCKPCMVVRNIKYRLKNIIKIKVASAQYYDKNKEKLKISAAKWLSKNKEKVSLTKSKWRENNLEKTRIAGSKWRISNPERSIKSINSAIKWRSENREKEAKSKKKYSLNLKDGYVALVIGMKINSIPLELIELKRVQLQIKRTLKELKK